MALQESERYSSKCTLIWEDEFIFGREIILKDAKYIMRISLQNSKNQTRDDTSSHLGLINNIVDKVKIAQRQEN